ncbi:thermonuclease family protein [uncultured Roseovarius sp.]|uniref:thermonuclease family protein n=1 Tax=uncultured Roseovarius sp. TaxID=293344 RepID=UPI00260AB6E3|nr:thermonuclease family protein [uncultured Roseovarius sp.]
MLRISLLIVLSLFPVASTAQGFGGPVRVVDGDTLDVGAVRVRLHGIDAPELGQICTNPDGATWDCGSWVADQLRARIATREARCNAVDTDRYGRTVATCSVAGQDIGRMLVSGGLALAYRKYSMAYDLDEKSAVVAGRGLHGHLMARPEDHRRAVREERAQENTAPNPACAIKGNRSGKDKRIYHMPGQADYDRTLIRDKEGERWFCTEAQARRAGWRRAKR